MRGPMPLHHILLLEGPNEIGDDPMTFPHGLSGISDGIPE